jgi:flotillin
LLSKKNGETGKAMADREKDVQIAETHRDRDENCDY